jgi:hypothetical protein
LVLGISGQAFAEPPDALSPAELRSRPSLRETGRVGGPRVEPQQPAPQSLGTAPDGAVSRERPIGRVAAAVESEAEAPAPAGVIDPAALEEELRDRLGAIEGCRIEVARRRRVPPAQVLADLLTLRFTIRPGGDVTGAEVVAETATDPALLACVKLAMASWWFTPPHGGAVAVQREVRVGR